MNNYSVCCQSIIVIYFTNSLKSKTVRDPLWGRLSHRVTVPHHLPPPKEGGGDDMTQGF